jgi:hypothetical protein
MAGIQSARWNVVLRGRAGPPIFISCLGAALAVGPQRAVALDLFAALLRPTQALRKVSSVEPTAPSVVSYTVW